MEMAHEPMIDVADPDQLERATAAALKRVARSSGNARYGRMPTRGSAAFSDLEQDLRLALLEAARENPTGLQLKVALAAAVNAGRRRLYGADRELPASAFEQPADEDDDGASENTPLDTAEGQPWQDPDEDPERPYAPERSEGLPPEWDTLRSWDAIGLLDAIDAQVVRGWGSDAASVAKATGLSPDAIRQRRHRLIEQVRSEWSRSVIGQNAALSRLQAPFRPRK